jgi:hypothetical protein
MLIHSVLDRNSITEQQTVMMPAETKSTLG